MFYVQYAHARICSVMRKAAEAGIDTGDAALAQADMGSLSDPAEIALIAKLADWPRQVEIAARGAEPHRIATYLSELAAELHAHWNAGNDRPELRFLQDDPEVSRPKIALARAVAVVISAGLGILGVEPVKEMR